TAGLKRPLIEAPDLNGRINQLVVAMGRVCCVGSQVVCAWQLDSHAPALWDICKSDEGCFPAPVRHVTQDHGQVDEGVLIIELRIEGAGIVPEASVPDANFGLAARGGPCRYFDAPGFFVQ